MRLSSQIQRFRPWLGLKALDCLVLCPCLCCPVPEPHPKEKAVALTKLPYCPSRSEESLGSLAAKEKLQFPRKELGLGERSQWAWSLF